MSYATDGKCHNSQPGTFGHECGKPAVWIGANSNAFRSGFCDQCKNTGYEAKFVVSWDRYKEAADLKNDSALPMHP